VHKSRYTIESWLSLERAFLQVVDKKKTGRKKRVKKNKEKLLAGNIYKHMITY